MSHLEVDGADPHGWFVRGREHLSKVLSAVETERDEVEQLSARLHTLEREQEQVHARLQAAVLENRALREASGGGASSSPARPGGGG
eukprot:COSAG01_NODE_19257_length_1021_cov_1.343818_1_plen_86_part_10